MEPLSGKYGVVDSVRTVRNWIINETVQVPKYVASNTLNGTGRKSGVISWAGSFSSYGHSPIHMPGEFFDFKGFTGPASGVLGEAGLTYFGSAIVDSVAITWNWKSGELLAHVTNFSGDLELNEGQDTLLDSSAPDAFSICGTKIEYATLDTPTVFTEWENVAQAVLTISATNPNYVNSSTHINGECWTGRRSGPIDFTLAITEENTSRIAAIRRSADLDLKLYVTSSLFWRLKWAHLENFSNINVDRESTAIIGRVANLGMNGFHPSTGVAGFMKRPDTSEFWPTNAGSSA